MVIELPGEAAPLVPQQVLYALQSASSGRQQSIQTGTSQLQTWESRRGYHALLQAAFADQSLAFEVRYLAVIQLKNGIDKFWRKSVPNAIHAEEKAEIRSRLIASGIAETNVQLALQNALAISKVVRIDYPQDWPNALTDLIAILRKAKDNDQHTLRSALLIVLQIIKELATARLRRSQTSLQATTPELVFVMGEIYVQKVGAWASQEGAAAADVLQEMQSSLLAIKILRRLLIAGYEFPHNDTEVKQLWALSQRQLGEFLNSFSQDRASMIPQMQNLLEKHLLQLSKLHAEMATAHPASFALLPNSLELARAYWDLVERYSHNYIKSTGGSGKERSIMERLSLKGLVLLRCCMKMVFSPTQTFKYKSPEVKQEQKSAVAIIKSNLLTQDLVSRMAQIIVTKFFVFRPADLEAWEEEPDEWEMREDGGGDTWEFEVRPCAEKLFMDLVINFKGLLEKPLLDFFASVAGPATGDVMTKDSVYTAMGLSAAVVFTNFDFDAFLATTLVKDVQQSGDSAKILRRRIAILIGQWITIKIDVSRRPLVYEIFRHLLDKRDPINDQVVRVTAARQLKTVVDDFSFDEAGFKPFASDLLTSLMTLIQEVDSVETKMAVLETIRIISVHLGSEIPAFADQIVQLLPALWDASGEEHLMKQAILTLLSSLVSAMKDASSRYHGLVLPLIQRAVEPGSDIQIYLLDEALDLWSSILQHAASPASSEVTRLAEHIFPLLEHGSDNLRVSLQILESYIILAPDVMLAPPLRLRLLSYATELLGTTKRDLAGLVTTCVEQLILAADQLGGTDGVAAVATDLVESGYAQKLLLGIHDAAEAHATTGPNRRAPRLDDVVETDYLTILARVALAAPAIFFTLLSRATGAAATDAWSWLAPEWFRHFDAMASVERQKLNCLALTRLLALPAAQAQALARDRLQDYVSMWTAVVTEMRDGRDADAAAAAGPGDNLVWTRADAEGDPDARVWQTAEDARKRARGAADAVHRVDTMAFVREVLAGFVAAVGGEEEFQRGWAADVDADVWAAFRRLLETGPQ